MLSASAKRARKKRTGTGGTQLKLIANPHYFDLGYAKGRKDFRSTSPTPASTLKQRSMSYQRGYLEGYADAADKKAARSNPKKRKNTRKSANPHCKRVNTPSGYRYMVNGKFATKAKYDRAKKRRR
tara:strand:+ start:236 stop:613 length:378 start_codon:yes stop_codon:yes gene_type:complete